MAHQKNIKPVGLRKQWKILSEYALARNGDPSKMSCADVLYENGPSVGEFLIAHYVARCVSPMLKTVTTKILEEPVPANSPVAPTPEPITPLPVLAEQLEDVAVVTPLASEKRSAFQITDPPKKKPRVSGAKKPKLVEPNVTIVL